DSQSESALHRLQRSAQDRQLPQDLSRVVLRYAGDGAQLIRALLCLFALAVNLAAAPARAEEVGKNAIVVFGAASLTNVLQDLGDTFTRETSIPVRFSFASSSALAKQIENGAPADVFFSADLDWMDYLEMR